MSIYSLYGTQIQFEISDNAANAYNRAIDAFKIMPPEVDLKDRQIHVDHEALAAYNAIADIMNILINLNEGPLTYTEDKDEFTTDYLIKK